MQKFIFSWVVSLVIILGLDFIWLSTTVSSFYKIYLKNIMTGDFKYLAALLFYILYSFALSYLVVVPGLVLNSKPWEILIQGLILGLASYGAYDLTNQATIKDWPIIVTIVDMLWGATVTGLTSLISFKICMQL